MNGKNLSVREALRWAVNELANIENPEYEANLLMAAAIGADLSRVFVRMNSLINCGERERFVRYVVKRQKGIPYHYITGECEFMSLRFLVDENVLIPRADTEILAETVLSLKKPASEKPVCVLDMCTGSGCVAVSLAHYGEFGLITGTDINEDAVKIAKRNGELNNTGDKIEWLTGDMFENIHRKYDIITGNPPYLSANDMNNIQLEVSYEPALALYGGTDGLDFYRIMAKEAGKVLNPDGYLAVEIGCNQGEAVIEILSSGFTGFRIIKDLSNRDRVVVCSKLNNG